MNTCDAANIFILAVTDQNLLKKKTTFFQIFETEFKEGNLRRTNDPKTALKSTKQASMAPAARRKKRNSASKRPPAKAPKKLKSDTRKSSHTLLRQKTPADNGGGGGGERGREDKGWGWGSIEGGD